ncbi:MAG TPA: RNA methyltransferase [Acidimicrobiales bacterium]
MLEGPDLVAAAVAAGATLEAVYFDDRANAPERASSAAALRLAAAHGVRLIELAPGVLDKVADAVTPQPVLGVAAMPRTDLSVVPAEGFVLVLDDVRDPGNLGTAVRSADAAGCAGVVVSGDSVDVFNPKTLRATAGSVFQVPLAIVDSLDEAIAALHASGRQVLGAVVHGGTPLWASVLSARTAVVVGSESSGLSEHARSLMDGSVTIEMAGRAESLNVGVASALICFESLRQRAVPGSMRPTL